MSTYCEGGTTACEVCVGSCGIEEFGARVAGLTKQRDDLLQRLLADPDRAAVATVDGLTKLLREDEALGRLLDWVGVAAMDSLVERLLFLCAEYLSRTGQLSVDTALALGRDVLAAGPVSVTPPEQADADA